MVRPTANESENAFAIDDDEDMDLLLEQAANAGSAAVADLGSTELSDDFEVDPFEVSSPVQNEEELAPVAEAASQGVEDEISDLLERIETERPDLQDSPVEYEEPVQVEAVTHAPEPVALSPRPAAQKPLSTQPMTTEREIALAQRVIATIDVYRSLSAESRDIVAQLLAPAAEDLSEDEGTIAIRAIHAEAIQESTQKALIEAKNSSPVDRVFYILGLPKDVLKHLGDLVQAYTSIELPTNGAELQYAKELVGAIEQLTDEPLIYADAMAKVLQAAQGA